MAPRLPKLFVVEPDAHGTHSDVDTALYCPATHAVQLTAPTSLSASVVEPAPHSRQLGCAALPWYWPAAQSAHATVGCELNCPAAHAVQLLAPLDARVSVMKPARQVSHGDVDTGLCWPAAHAEHAVAPTAACTLVSKPDKQSAHATVDSLLYRPAAHAVQLTPPVDANVSVNEPGLHTKQ